MPRYSLSLFQKSQRKMRKVQLRKKQREEFHKEQKEQMEHEENLKFLEETQKGLETIIDKKAPDTLKYLNA